MAPIREAVSDDLPRLRELQAALDRPNPDLLAAALSGVGTVLVSVADGRPVGYLVAIPGAESAHLAELAVAPDYRREGRASALLDAAADRLAVARLTLAVAPENGPARRCYERAGFRTVERDPDYYDGEPALVMARTVSPASGSRDAG